MQSSEFLTCMKRVPPKDSVEHDAFWDNEHKKAEYGITVNGVFIPGFLYWHTQLWNIYIDEKDSKNHVVKRVFKHPSFRDNEWIISEGLEEAQQQKKGMLIFGARRLGKSEFLASHLGRMATLYKGSENIVTGGNWGDIDVIMYKLTQGLNYLPDYFKFGRLSENLRKEIELGFKDKKGTRLSWSKIIARNHEEGLKTEAVAGLTATSFVMDEVGKSIFAQVFEAAKPAFTSPYGWRCVPILTGTSGDIKGNSDAQKFFENPEAYNFISRELKEEGNKKVSIFINGLRRMEGKYETTLANYIENEKGILVPKDSDLYNIPFLNSDFEKAEKVIDEERLQASKSPDQTALLKATMYYPKNTKELFLTDDGNTFPIEAIKEQIAYLEARPEFQGRAARVYRDVDGKARLSYNTTKQPIYDYPLDAKADLRIKDAAIMIYEEPELNAPLYLYIAGADPYNASQTVNSESLGSFYIFKRIKDPINGTFQRRIVASYTARTPDIKEFYQNIELLLELYNAIVLPENAPGNTFVQYFDLKNKGYFIADTYNFLKEISPTTSIKGQPKGLPPTTGVQKFYKELVFNYLTEIVDTGIDNNNGERITKLGVSRITDIGLLKELLAFNDKGNFDRYVAFGHTLAHEAWADKIYPMTFKENTQEVKKDDSKQEISIKSPFSTLSGNPFGRTHTNPFGIK